VGHKLGHNWAKKFHPSFKFCVITIMIAYLIFACLFFFQRQDWFEQRDPQDSGGGGIRGGVRWNLQSH